jgi:hypothetical protein
VTTHTTDTLVGVNGLRIVAPFALFLVLSVAAWLGLHAICSTGSRARMVGTWAAGLLAAAAVFTFSAGFLALPAALLVIVATALTPARQAREM